jgi:membrane protease YdiL (CAAX protease family)
MLFPTALAWVYFVALAQTPESTSGRNPAAIAAYVAGKLIQFGFPLIWMRGVRPRRPSVRDALVALAVGTVVSAVILLFYFGFLRPSPLLADTPGRIRAKVGEYGLTQPAAFILFGAFIAVFHSFLEEYYWRWFVYGRLRSLLNLPGALALSSLAFMSHHIIVLAMFFPGRFWQMAMPLALGVGLGGVLFGWLYERHGGIWAPWIAHALIDAAIMFMGFDLVFRT